MFSIHAPCLPVPSIVRRSGFRRQMQLRGLDRTLNGQSRRSYSSAIANSGATIRNNVGDPKAERPPNED